MRSNLIVGNECIGVFVREKSLGDLSNNVVEDNEIELVSEFYVDGVNDLANNNKIVGDVRIPPESECGIF
jgi:hypothetical protein